MEISNFDQLLHRYLTNQVTDEERKKIEIWLELRKATGPEKEISKEIQEAIFKRITSKIETPQEFEVSVQREKRLRTSWWLLRIAAVLIVGVSLFYLGLYVATNVHHVADGKAAEKVILQDGSIIWLRNKATLVYSETPTKRYAKLNGDGFFEVAKDATRPFQVDCGSVVIEVTGTSFDVQNAKDQFELKVLTGSVRVSRSDNPESVEVVANEKLVVNASQPLLKSNFSAPDIADVVASTEYSMVFKNTPLTEVADRIARKFDVKVTIDNKEAGRCRVTADFTDKSLDTTLKMVTEILDLKYSTTSEGLLLAGPGCQKN